MRRIPVGLLVLLLGLGACAHGPRGREGDLLSMQKAMARELVQRGDYDGALDVLGKLYRQGPADAEVLALRGVVFREQRLLVEARTELQQALEVEPDLAFAHAALGIVLDLQGDGPAARRHHQRAVQLEPGNPAHLNNLGFSCFVRGGLAEAIAHYRAALRLDPNSARIRNNLGFALARTGDFTAAAEQFDRAGPAPEARNNLGYAYELDGNLAQAFEQYLQAARSEAVPGRARRNLEHLANRMGRAMPADLAGREGAPQ